MGLGPLHSAIGEPRAESVVIGACRGQKLASVVGFSTMSAVLMARTVDIISQALPQSLELATVTESVADGRHVYAS